MLDDVRRELNRQNYGKILGRLLKESQEIASRLRLIQHDAERDLTVRKSLGPVLAELFQPQHGREWSCFLLHAARTKPAELMNHLDDLGSQQFGLPPSIALRAETLRLVRTDVGRPIELRGALQRLLRRYRDHWQTSAWESLTAVPNSQRPAAWKGLETRAPQLAKVLDELVTTGPLGWQDPAAAFLADALLECAGGRVAPVAMQPGEMRCGRTWVLIAVDHPAKRTSTPTGLLLLLDVEKLANGCGAFYPHPDHAAHLQMTDSFQQALHNAWRVVLGSQNSAATQRTFDYRWSLLVVDDSHEAQVPEAPESSKRADDVLWHRLRHLLCFRKLTGRSGEIALACALQSAARQIPLDLSRAVTGRFSGESPSGPNPTLETVLGVLTKELGIDAADELLQRSVGLSRIQELVLPTHQSLPLPLARSPVSVPDFQSAWNALSNDSLLTQQYHAAALAATRAWFRDHCFADDQHPLGSYILNHLQRPGHKQPLTPARADLLTSGQVSQALRERETNLPQRLVKIVADSGIGKTSFLVYCQHQISTAARETIAIRVEHLTTFLAGSRRVDFLDAAEKHIVAVLTPGASQKDGLRTEVRNWLERKADRGEIVWLLDALDQMSQHREHVPELAKSFPECPMILTLREDADQQFADVIQRDQVVRWVRLDLRPFREEDARTYLGPYADLFFKRLPVQDRSDDKEGHVLTIPLLLHLLKDLAIRRGLDPQARTVDLPEFRNRYAIYQAVLSNRGGLLDKGYQTLKHRDPAWDEQFDDLQSAVEVLEELASAQVSGHHFDTVVPRELSKKLKRALLLKETKSPLRTLRQLNLLTGLPTFDEAAAGGLKWRHRSFLEYFGGCRLVELFQDPATRHEAVDVLRDVQSVLDKHGEIRRDHDFLNADGETIRHLPREWEWTLRFALCHAQGQDRDALAWQLIRLGNPWVVYESLERDQLPLDPNLEQVCKWLVDLDYSHRVYREGWPVESQQPPVRAWGQWCDKDAEQVLKDLLLDRSTRDGAYLPPLRKLLEATVSAPDTPQPIAMACQTALATYTGQARQMRSSVLQTLLGRTQFVQIPAGDFDPALFHGEEELKKSGVTGPITIPAGLRMGDFPVTNAEVEAWCPTQRRWRGKSSHADDQPAVYVSSFMGMEFSEWLTGTPTEGAFGLPTEWEWEYACRAGSMTEYWCGDVMRDYLCWIGFVSRCSGTRSRQATLAAEFATGLMHPWGLHDMHGNVWEWCASQWDRSDSAVLGRRVVRGGSWNDYVISVRSGRRHDDVPDRRSSNIGLRLVWRPRLVLPESSSPL